MRSLVFSLSAALALAYLLFGPEVLRFAHQLPEHAATSIPKPAESEADPRRSPSHPPSSADLVQFEEQISFPEAVAPRPAEPAALHPPMPPQAKAEHADDHAAPSDGLLSVAVPTQPVATDQGETGDTPSDRGQLAAPVAPSRNMQAQDLRRAAEDLAIAAQRLLDP